MNSASEFRCRNSEACLGSRCCIAPCSDSGTAQLYARTRKWLTNQGFGRQTTPQRRF